MSSTCFDPRGSLFRKKDSWIKMQHFGISIRNTVRLLFRESRKWRICLCSMPCPWCKPNKMKCTGCLGREWEKKWRLRNLVNYWGEAHNSLCRPTDAELPHPQDGTGLVLPRSTSKTCGQRTLTRWPLNLQRLDRTRHPVLSVRVASTKRESSESGRYSGNTHGNTGPHE